MVVSLWLHLYPLGAREFLLCWCEMGREVQVQPALPTSSAGRPILLQTAPFLDGSALTVLRTRVSRTNSALRIMGHRSGHSHCGERSTKVQSKHMSFIFNPCPMDRLRSVLRVNSCDVGSVRSSGALDCIFPPFDHAGFYGAQCTFIISIFYKHPTCKTPLR